MIISEVSSYNYSWYHVKFVLKFSSARLVMLLLRLFLQYNFFGVEWEQSRLGCFIGLLFIAPKPWLCPLLEPLWWAFYRVKAKCIKKKDVFCKNLCTLKLIMQRLHALVARISRGWKSPDLLEKSSKTGLMQVFSLFLCHLPSVCTAMGSL